MNSGGTNPEQSLLCNNDAIAMKTCGLLAPSSSRKRPRQDVNLHTPASTKALLINEKIQSPVDFLKALFSLNETTKAWMEQQQDYCFSRPSEESVKSYDMAVVKAIREGNAQKLRDMFLQGRTFDASNRFGESLIHMACRRGDMNVIEFLIEEAGVRLDVSDDFGRTPLHDACWTSKPNLDVVGLLLKKVPPNMFLMEDVRGHTPFHYARREHWPTWVAFLQENAQLILQRVSILQAIKLIKNEANECSRQKTQQ